MPTNDQRTRASRIALSGALVVLTVVLTTLARLALGPLLGRRAALIMYFPALVLSAWVGGWGGGLLALALSTLATTYFFLSPHHGLSVPGQADQLTLLVFAVVGLSVSALSASQRRAHQRAEESATALRESEGLRRAALAVAPMVLWAMDAQGVITLAEGSGLALAGVTQADYVGRSVFALSEEATLQAAWRRALAGEDAAYDTANGGVLFHNELRPQRDAGGAVTGVIGIAVDVTGREAAEAALREAAERQKGLLRDVLASVTGGRLRLVEVEADLPAPLPQVIGPIPLTPSEGLRSLRQHVRDTACALGFADERWQDLVTAASEGGMNAVTHGGGRGEARVSSDGGGGTVQVRVRDWGAGINMQDLPRAALSRGWSSTTSLGHGLVMMLQSVDRLWLLTGEGGTTVVMEQDREEPPPAWL